MIPDRPLVPSMAPTCVAAISPTIHTALSIPKLKESGDFVLPMSDQER